LPRTNDFRAVNRWIAKRISARCKRSSGSGLRLRPEGARLKAEDREGSGRNLLLWACKPLKSLHLKAEAKLDSSARIPVAVVLELLAAGETWESILEGRPEVSREDLQEVLLFAKESVEHTEVVPLTTVS
jgi:uncharacterized protein DUF433